MRQRQADETRLRILSAARELLVSRGFDGMTIDAIAQAAGVSAQTVYAAYGSKRGVVRGLIDRARFGPDYFRLIEEVGKTPEPEGRVRLAAAIARKIYSSESEEMEFLSGAGAVSPELAAMMREREGERFDSQKGLVTFLDDSGSLRPGLDKAKARDVLWVLTGRDTYRLLVAERKWSPAQYETWLGDLLVSQLLGKEPKRARAKKKKG